MPESEIIVYRMEMLDTGLGREAGFRDDAELIAKAKEEREALDPVVREIADQMDAAFLDAAING